MFHTREHLHRYVGAIYPRHAYLEFGVAAGESLAWWAGRELAVGIDGFEGLPELWAQLPAGHFASDPRTARPRGVPVIVGRFDEPGVQSLVRAVVAGVRGAGGLLVVHLDADLYASTASALESVVPLSGDVLIVDEWGWVSTMTHHAQRAVVEWAARHGMRLDYIAHLEGGHAYAFRVEVAT